MKQQENKNTWVIKTICKILIHIYTEFTDI